MNLSLGGGDFTIKSKVGNLRFDPSNGGSRAWNGTRIPKKKNRFGLILATAATLLPIILVGTSVAVAKDSLPILLNPFRKSNGGWIWLVGWQR